MKYIVRIPILFLMLITLILVTASNAFADDLAELTWAYSGIRGAIGCAGFEVANRDTPQPEFIHAIATTSGNHGYWSIFSYDETAQTYTQTWTSLPKHSMGIARIIHEDLARYNLDKVAIVYYTSLVEIYDRKTRTLEYAFHTGNDKTRDAKVADTDGDGIPELIISWDDQVTFFNLTTGDPLQSFDVPAGAVCCGQMDDDPGQELAVSGIYSNPGVVIDLDTGTAQWVAEKSFGNKIRSFDIDADGKDEIVGLQGLRQIAAYDVDLQTAKWTYSISREGGFCIHDDVLTGDVNVYYENNGTLYCINGSNGSVTWSSRGVPAFSAGINIADGDNDGVPELYYGSGKDWFVDRHLVVVDTGTQDVEWLNEPLGTPFVSFDAGNIDDDPQDELVLCCQSIAWGASAESPYILIFDAQSLRLKTIQDVTPKQGHTITELTEMLMADFNPIDDNLEIIIGGSMNCHGFESLDQQAEWSRSLQHGSGLAAAVADLDNDSELEAVFAALGLYEILVCLDAATGGREYRIDGPNRNTSDLCVGDLNLDGLPDIGIASSSHGIQLYQGSTGAKTWESSFDKAVSVVFADLHPEIPGLEILAGCFQGGIHVIDGINYSYLWSAMLGDGQVTSMVCIDIAGDSNMEIVTAVDGRVKIFDNTGQLLWQSAWLGDNAGFHGGLICGDINNDGLTEILVSSNHAFYMFTVTNPDAAPQHQSCDVTGVNLAVSCRPCRAGDAFNMEIRVCNAQDTILQDYPLVMLLSYQGEFWFAPGWSSEFDYELRSFSPGVTRLDVFPGFIWPDGVPEISYGLTMYASLLTPDLGDLFGAYGAVDIVTQ